MKTTLTAKLLLALLPGVAIPVRAQHQDKPRPKATVHKNYADSLVNEADF